MKKKFIVLLTMFILMFSLVGCGTTYQEAKNNKEDFCNGYFTVVEKWSGNGYEYRILYANNTKVKYIGIEYMHGFAISPLYNADGTLQIYNGE